ncbi:MAG: biotin--[Alphaproteobacteria bacterium]|nr:biotin--[acetyl-CoA-carboxylase] ligase [Alphaproteobacteria bacterium]
MAEYEEWKIYCYDEVTSTNDVIKDYCSEPKQKIVVWAKNQTEGRGRLGRRWQSLRGNLFFSCALEIDMADLSGLVILCGLSLCQIIKELNPQNLVQIKWPNDVLINEAKVSGMLLEKGPNDYIIIGIGVNIINYPQAIDIIYKTTSLQHENITISPENLLKCFISKFNANKNLWQHCGNNEKLVASWLKFAKGIGKKLLVRQNNVEICGMFQGIDANGCLLLENEQGVCHIRAGDVFYTEEN